MALPPVAAGDPHAAAHNSERDLINDIQDVVDPTFKAALDEEISTIAPVESVNGQIGPVVLDAADVGAATPADIVTASAADRNRINHSGLQTAATIEDLIEAVQDILGASIAAGSNMTMDYNDTTGIITLSAVVDGAAISTDPEVVRDTMGNALVGAGLITVAVNDAADTITISTTATTNRSDGATDVLLAAKLDKTAVAGGATGQVLAKTSAVDYAFAWQNVAAAGFDPDTFLGDYDAAAAYSAGESVEFDGRVYVANTNLAANTHNSTATFVGAWSDDNATTNTFVDITVPAGSVQVGDLLVFSYLSGTSTAIVGTAGWTYSPMANHPNGGYVGLAYRYAVAADVSAGFNVQVSSGYTGSTGMVRAYRGGRFYGLSEFRHIGGTLNAPATTNPFGKLRNRVQVNFMMTYSGTTHTVTTGWAGVTNYLTSEPSPFDAFSIHAADKAVSAASTDWAALTGFTVGGSTGSYTTTQVNIYDTPDPSDWTYSEALTAMLVTDPLIVATVVNTVGAAASASYSVTSNTFVPINANTLLVMFDVPESGRVQIDVSLVYLMNSATYYGELALLDSANVFVPGSNRRLGNNTTYTPVVVSWVIEGLTPGSSQLFRLGAGVTTGGSMTIPYGGDVTSATVMSNRYGPIEMEVWRA